MSGNIDETDYVKHAAEMQRKFLAAALDARDIDELEEVSAACFAEEAAFVDEMCIRDSNCIYPCADPN